jgi:hypothetical protein
MKAQQAIKTRVRFVVVLVVVVCRCDRGVLCGGQGHWPPRLNVEN